MEDFSSGVWAGSQEATRRWLRARATFARLRIMSVEDIFLLPCLIFLLFSLFLIAGFQDGQGETFDNAAVSSPPKGPTLGLASSTLFGTMSGIKSIVYHNLFYGTKVVVHILCSIHKYLHSISSRTA